MAISYSNFDTNFADTIGRVNALSPSMPKGPTAAGTSSSLFSMTPDTIGSDFDASYKGATAGYDPFPGDHSKIDQLQGLYETVPQAFDVSNTLKAMDSARGTSLLTGEQAASTAAKKYQESQIPGFQSGTGAAMVRAQSLLPFLQADTASAQTEGQYADTAKQGALTTAAGIANNLAQLQQNYTDSLAKYNADKANFGLQYAQGKSNLQLTASTANTQNQLDLLKTQMQIAENAREANLSAALNQRNQDLQAAQTATNQKLTSAQDILAQKGPTGGWTTDNSGRVTEGQQSYDAYQNYLKSRASALAALGGIAY